MRGILLFVCLLCAVRAEAKGCGGRGGAGGHGGGHGGSHAHGGGGGRSTAIVFRAVYSGAAAQPYAGYDRDVEALRALAPSAPPSGFTMPTAAETLLGVLDHSFDRRRELDSRLGEMWSSPSPASERIALLHAVWIGLADHADVRSDFQRFLATHLPFDDAERVLAELH